jgi:phosphohistidine phosphatase SixA
MKLSWFVLSLLASIATAAAQQAAPSGAPSSPGSMLSGKPVPAVPIPAEVLASEGYKSLVADLRQGGFVIYLRHAVTETTPEPVVRDLADCGWQRDLSADGRRQAAAIGARLAELQVPVTTVEASPFCRTRQTAEIAFGRAPTINGELFYHVTQTPEQVAAANARLRARLAAPPPRGANIVLVGHSPTMKEASGVELPEGQGAVVRPAGDGTFRIMARLTESGIMPAP